MAERIEGLSVGLDLDSAGLDRSLSDIKRSFRGLDSSIRTNMNNMKYGEKSMANYESTVSSLNEDITKQRKNLDDLGKKHADAVREQGANSRAATKLATEYNKQADNLNYLERQLEGVTQEMKEFERSQSGWGKMSSKMDQYSQKLTGLSEKMSELGETMTTGVTAPILAAGGLFVKSASDMESSQARVQNALGLTANEAERVAGVARDVYADGWGESFQQVEESIIQVGQQLDLLDDPQQLQDITTKAIGLERVFGMDMNETLRGVNSLMESYGLTAAESMDYITVGAQNGLNKTDELGDNLAEYATLFEENGYSAEEMFSVLEAGLDAGAYNLDKVNDLVKEFGIRVGDGTIRDAVAELGGEWQNIYETWEASGEANDVLFEKLAQNLASIEDPQEKQLALTEIWGSMGEDAGFKVIEAMGQVEGKYNDVNGATEKMVETTEKTFGQRFQSLLRDAADAFLPLGEVLLELGEQYLPKVSDLVERLSTGLRNMDEDTLNAGLKIAGLTAVIGPLLKVGSTLVGSFGKIAGVIGKVAGKIVGKGGLVTALAGKVGLTGALGKVATFLTGPWGVAIATGVTASVGLYNHLTEEAIPSVKGFGDQVSDSTSKAMTKFNELHETAVQEMTLLFAESDPITKEGTVELRNAFTGMYEQIKQASKETKNEQIGNIQQLFAQSGTKIDEGEQVILDKLSGHYENRNTQLDNMYNRQQEILQTAADEERALTQAEEEELARLNNEMQGLAIETLSKSEQEQIAIKETMSNQKGAIDARTAADTVQESKKAKDGVINEAEQKYEEVVANAAYQRDVTGSITSEEADEIISQATRERDEAISKAEDMHDDVVREAQNQAGEHADAVDWETGEVLNRWERFKNSASGIWDRVSQKAKDTFNDLRRFFGRLWDSITGGFESALNGVERLFDAAWNNVTRKTNSVIRTIQSGINGLIDGLNWVLDKLGSDKHVGSVSITPVSYGSSPNAYAEGTDGHPGGPAIVGDGGMKELIVYPDGKIGMSPDTDTLIDMPKGTQVMSGPDTKDFMSAMGVPHYAGGIGDALSNIGNKVWSWLSDGASTLLDNVLETAGISMPDVPGILGDIGKAAFSYLKDAAINSIDGLIPDFSNMVGNVGGGVQQWSGVASQALMMTGQYSPGNLNSLLYQMQTESGGNPRAQNNWDINAMMGTPSKGLMQVIDPTFQAHKMPGYGNIWNPLDNILASIRYAVSRYGSLNAAYRGVGYADGGIVNEPGVYPLAENGWPEFVIPTEPSKRSNAMKLLALAGKRIQGDKQKNKSANQLSNPSTNDVEPVEGGDTYHIHITANGDLPQSVIRRMADRIDQEIKKKNDRKRMARGEEVSFS